MLVETATVCLHADAVKERRVNGTPPLVMQNNLEGKSVVEGGEEGGGDPRLSTCSGEHGELRLKIHF